MNLKPLSDRVILKAVEAQVDGEEYTIVRQNDILAIVE